MMPIKIIFEMACYVSGSTLTSYSPLQQQNQNNISTTSPSHKTCTNYC